MLIKGVHTKEQTKKAKEGAEFLLNEHKTALDGGKGEQAFGSLPEGSRSTWGRCEEPRLMSYFDFEKNKKICSDIIGPFEFKHHYPGPGYYTFAPRFYSWHQNPKVAEKDSQVDLIQPFDLNNLPKGMSEWSCEFLRNAAELGIRFAPCKQPNWHIDGIDYNSVATFAILWGSYLNSLPKGNMGNLSIKPGTHHVIADMLNKQGKTFHYDGKKQKAKPLPELAREGIADGKSYELLVEEGDILLAHPWLAHGIGKNMSKQIRLAVYCRLANNQFYTIQRPKMANQKLNDFSKGLPEPNKWKGDYWENVPEINKWFKANKDTLMEYDGGRLQ